MKMYTFLITLICIGACKTSDINGISKEKDVIPIVQNDKKYCPDDGNCTVALHKNSSLLLKKDTIDAYYPSIENGESIVVVFTFSKKGPDGIADGAYSETIHFEVNKNVESLNIKGDKLKEVNLLFGKHCFCRGEAGYYTVNEGNLIIQQSKDELTIDLSFTVHEVSHRIIRIKEVVKM